MAVSKSSVGGCSSLRRTKGIFIPDDPELPLIACDEKRDDEFVPLFD